VLFFIEWNNLRALSLLNLLNLSLSRCTLFLFFLDYGRCLYLILGNFIAFIASTFIVRVDVFPID
jgi:hypothetical protein